ncbi:MAG: flagellar biosynthesis protein FliQ [Deltaproteobacteria bacterium]|nr:flagellar biosynthesis protein FliQ [Deltaproteobacteria bacterium]
MSPEFVVDLGRKAIETILLVSAPMLVAALVIGLIISLFQAATQINEQTMTFVPKIVGVLVSLLLFGPWIIKVILAFTRGIFEGIPLIGP